MRSGREYSYREQTKENWVVILNLATRWEFPKIKELTIRELEALHLPPAEMVSIYNRFGIEGDQLLSSYVELCKSPTLPTEAEGHLLEMETLINILQAREDAKRETIELRRRSPTSAGLEDDDLRKIVSKFFKKGLDPRSSGTSTGSEVQASNLTGERAHGTSASETITIKEPQVPNRKAESTSRPSSHAVGGICATIELSQLMHTHRTVLFRQATRERKVEGRSARRRRGSHKQGRERTRGSSRKRPKTRKGERKRKRSRRKREKPRRGKRKRRRKRRRNRRKQDEPRRKKSRRRGRKRNKRGRRK